MRLGGPVFVKTDDPEELARAHRALGYRAAYCPEVTIEDAARIRALRQAYEKHDVKIAEVGVWNNLMDVEAAKRKANIDAMKKGLALADEIGAQCVVNIGGSHNPTNWAGPHLDNMSEESYEMAVATAREIIDAVKPKRAKMTYEPMPFCLPDSPSSYLRLIEDIDRPEFGVHMDAVNFINGTDRFIDTTSVVKESFEKLGPYVVSCHLKDITMDPQCLTVHLDEVLIGEGAFDNATYLREIAKLPQDPPVLLEHLKTEAEYTQARECTVGLAAEIGVSLAE
jgi:sugar phosphate isomerase/epimerase